VSNIFFKQLKKEIINEKTALKTLIKSSTDNLEFTQIN